MKYKIMRMRKDRTDKRFLSQKKKRWLPYGSKHRVWMGSEKEANEFIEKKGDDTEYYYFKALSNED